MLRFGSVCSGIEAASVAWNPLGWQAAWVAEIEPFPSAVLAHHYPGVPNLGDMTQLPWLIDAGLVEAPDVFCGGTPCQAFSVAGLRHSLDDARGNLSLTFCEIADAIDRRRVSTGLAPAIVFWENVPGVLSTKDNAFGCFLAGLAGEDDALVAPGEKWTDAGVVLGPKRAVAWRTLDAQYFGLAQRRKRVFTIASYRDGFDPAQVLFEFEGVRRDSAPSRRTGEAVTPTIAPCLDASFGRLQGTSGQDANHGHGHLVTTVPVAIHDISPSLTASNDPSCSPQSSEVTQQVSAVYASAMQVRRLTPTECERLQGFPDGYTNISWRGKPEAPDGPRYKALENSWAVPVIRWIGMRIAQSC